MTRDFIQGELYSRAAVLAAIGDHALDGAFAIAGDVVALFAELGDADGAAHLPTRSELRWPAAAPWRVVQGVATLVFVGAGDEVRFLGVAKPCSYPDSGGLRDVTFVLDPPLARELWLELIGTRALPDDAPEQELVALAGDAAPDQVWRALEAFVAAWYRTPFATASETDGTRIGPPLLHRLARLARAVPELFQHNRLVPESELRVGHGRVVFLVENQAVCEWATEPSGDDPRVWYRDNDHRAAWLEEAEPLSWFLVHAVVMEAILGAPFGGSAAAPRREVVDELRARLGPLGSAAWRWGAARFYARAGALAMMMDGSVFLAARTPHALTPFADLVDDTWEHVAL
ncbi:MAG: hypothetical protein ACM31C_04230 [Acidobacteriota bacterium]